MNIANKKPVILFFLVILFNIGFWIPLTDCFSNDAKGIPPAELSKQVKYSFTIQNKTNRLIENGELFVYAPIAKNSFQTCTAIESSLPFQLIKNKNKNQVLFFLINDLPPFATWVINLKASIVYDSIPQKMDADNRQIYLLPEPYIESDHPEMIFLAKKLKALDPLKTAQNIYDWVCAHIEYTGYLKHNLGALYALKHKKGDCTEFMSLFIALCRANNIPARGIGGYVCTGNCLLMSNTWHNWAEFYVNGSWLMADCQKKVFARENSTYIAMQIISNDKNNPIKGHDRFRFQGTGLKVKMN
ncbi:MAG: transglutaminase-like domain-containing protein [Pseudomonadota bacterium]